MFMTSQILFFCFFMFLYRVVIKNANQNGQPGIIIFFFSSFLSLILLLLPMLSEQKKGREARPFPVRLPPFLSLSPWHFHDQRKGLVLTLSFW